MGNGEPKRPYLGRWPETRVLVLITMDDSTDFSLSRFASCITLVRLTKEYAD